MTPTASEYCARHGIVAIRRLGQGKDGTVYETDRPSALKVFAEPDAYRHERDAYVRLRERGITRVCGMRIPTMFAHDDAMQAIEMSIVQPPFVLDFASAWLDFPPDFCDEVVQQWHDEIRERFGPRFADVMSVLDALAAAGVYLLDVHPHNIKFE